MWLKTVRIGIYFFAERPRSPTPDRWRDECRERSDQALGVPAGSHSLDRLVRTFDFRENIAGGYESLLTHNASECKKLIKAHCV